MISKGYGVVLAFVSFTGNEKLIIELNEAAVRPLVGPIILITEFRRVRIRTYYDGELRGSYSIAFYPAFTHLKLYRFW